MTDCSNCLNQIEAHEGRIAAIERRQEATESKLDAIGRDIIAIRAEGTARAEISSASMDRLSKQMSSLERSVSEHIGATKERAKIDGDRLILEQTKLTKIRRYATIIGIILTFSGVVAGSILSSQTWDDYFFGNVAFLHGRHMGTS